ncbi:MAG: hypothetical protein N5P05_002649 [Chroococcopsis gigantea SAG 12.99]|jgi:predicted nucleotidyltransferase|nr:nucleotidyltransferase domain-containing protein [Chlorogloea purpurea SAG 13.99]MDV3001043.1 hypothetical protein [Chroococcopsis gigantea SAG 12.99]
MNHSDEITRSQIVARVLEARKNRPQFLEGMRLRQQKGLAVAHKIARILREEFGVQKIVLFGSMLSHENLSPHSDIDLAVWGLNEKDYFKAGAVIERGYNFSVDLVEVEKAKPHILRAIEKGVEL